MDLAAMVIRLLIVDDHEIVREGLRMAFQGTDVVVVAEAINGRDAFEKLSHHAVDVALVDIRMPSADGFTFLELLRSAHKTLPVVVMHTADEGSKSARRCREMGARGLILKGDERPALLDAIRQVHAGHQLWEPDPPAAESNKIS